MKLAIGESIIREVPALLVGLCSVKARFLCVIDLGWQSPAVEILSV